MLCESELVLALVLCESELVRALALCESELVLALALQSPGELCESALVVDHTQVLDVQPDVAGTPARQ